jgi:outer membrane scaffolding protein for murein synthesis (MipA/OmpV family)
MRIRLRILTVIAALLVTATTEAQEQASGATAAPPDPQAVRWSLGLGVISAPRPYVGASNKTIPIPLVELYYKRFYVQGIRFGYNLLKTDRVTIDARVDTVFAGLDPDDSPFLEGMEERKGTLFGGVGIDWKLGKFDLGFTAFTDMLGRSDGQQASMDLSRQWTFGRYRWGLSPSVGVVWQSASLVDYYFGVSPEEARPDRPEFEGQAALNLRAGILTFYRLSPRLSLIALLRWQRLDNEIGDSPIVDKPRGYFGLAGITYRFGSEQYRAP